MVQQRRGSAVVGVASVLPPDILTNSDLEQMLATNDEWIYTRTGIRERRRGSTTTQLSIDSGRAVLERTGFDPAEIDLVIVATQTPDDFCPSTAASVQHALGLRAAAFDLNAACTGFVYAVICAHTMLAAGHSAALVIGVDRMTAATNYEDRSTAILFGDGAGAVILRRSDDESRGIQGWDMGTDGSHRDILVLPVGGTVAMNGPQVFKQLARKAVDSARFAAERAGIELDDIKGFYGHQANQRLLDAVADGLGVEHKRFASVIERIGNTSAGSIPLALDPDWDDLSPATTSCCWATAAA